jgi:MFS family permease
MTLGGRLAAAMRGSVLAHGRFRVVFGAQTLVELADQVLVVAVAWAVISHATGTELGFVLACWAIPRGLFLLFGGVLVDRVDRRLLAVGCGVGLAVLTCGLGVLDAFGGVPLGVWVPAAVLLGLLDGIRLPIGYSLLPLVVPEDALLDANRWSQLRLWATVTLGPAIGGALAGLPGVPTALITTGGCYFFGGLLLLRLPKLGVERTERTNLAQDFAAGLRLIGRDPRLRLLLPVFAAVNLFVLGVTAVGVPLLVQQGLHASATALGFLSGSFGVGLMLGTLAMPKLPKPLTSSMAGLFGMFVLSDGFLGITGLAPSVAAGCVLFGLSGLFLGPASTCYQTILQSSTPPEYLGRVTSTSRAISFGLEPLSAALVGIVSRSVAIRWIVLVGGLAAAAIDTIAILRGRELDRTAEPTSSTTEDAAEPAT